MLKYILIAKNTLQEYFVYRFNFIAWRLQMFISFVIFYYLWFSVSQGKSHLGSYTIPQIYAYFIIGYIVRAMVFTTRTADIGGEIQSGSLSNLLLKPIGIIKYYFARDVIDKIFNLSFLTVEFAFILILFRPSIYLPGSSNLIFSLIFLAIAAVSFFFYSLIISFLTFWVEAAWPTRFLFGNVFVNLFSGQFIPLDLLPPTVYRILSLTPYPYLYFFPVRIWLEMEPSSSLLFRLFLALLMMLFLFLLAQFLWLKGKQQYQSYGN